MKSVLWAAALALLPLLAGCGGKSGGEAPGADSTAFVAPAAQQGPASDPASSSRAEAEIDGHRYEVKMRRYADKSGEVVRNELGEESYDNRVDVSILRDGSAFKRKTFSKADFADFLTDTDRAVSVLQGMAFTGADAEGLHFAAQVGERDVEGGMAFIVTVSTDGLVSVVRDYNQDTTGSASQ